MNNRPFHFDRMNRLVDEGWLCALGEVELKVWLVLHREANEEGRVVDWSLSRIRAKLGHRHDKHIRLALRSLVAVHKLISVEREATSRAAAVYRVHVPPQIVRGVSPAADGVAATILEIESANLKSRDHTGRDAPLSNDPAGSPFGKESRDEVAQNPGGGAMRPEAQLAPPGESGSPGAGATRLPFFRMGEENLPPL